MPKPKGKLEKVTQEDIEINLDDIKAKESQPTILITKNKIREVPSNEIRQVLDELKAQEGVVGYILRNSKSASIDLNDPARIVDYAVLSSSALDFGAELSKTFDLGEINHVLVEGKDTKLLSLTIGETNISVFMEKNVNHNDVYKTLSHIA